MATATKEKIYETFETLKVTEVADRVANVELNRPDKRNALNIKAFDEIKRCFEALAVDKYYRAVVLTGAGKLFCAGIDLMALQEGLQASSTTDDVARKSLLLKEFIRSLQLPQHAIYLCRKPVIAATHGGGNCKHLRI